MTRQVKTLLFLAGGTLFNLVATGLFFVVLLVLYGLTLGRILPGGSAAIALLACFILSVILGGLAYRQALVFLRKKVNLDAELGWKRKD